MPAFKRAAVFTDIHFGLKSNSQLHNDDCLNFVDWVIKTAKEQDCDTCIMMGDWHNNRASINIVTLNYSLNALERLGKAFDRVLFIPGNHDLYYRDKRDVQSAEWAKHIPNIQIVNDFYNDDDIIIVPWLVGDEHKKIPKMSGKYMFGHFELPNFYMNAMVQMPDHGDIKNEHFGGIEHVFSGHFHKRQTQGNITYTGNAFPHNYADAGDDDRGLMILDWSGEKEFISWPDQPSYRVYDLSQIIDHADDILKPNMHVRVNLDIEISYEEANFIKDTFVGTHKLREITLMPRKNEHSEQDATTIQVEFKSVDQIVTNQITAIDSNQFDKKLLLDIYQNL
jgi:DNA repair exonuclease SbcCD nuclease subunit